MLNDEEQRRTSRELHTNRDLSGRSIDQIAADLDLAPAEVQSTLDLDGAAPETVWWLRDYLEDAATEAGAEPVPYTVLTEEMRGAAERWYPLRPRR